MIKVSNFNESTSSEVNDYQDNFLLPQEQIDTFDLVSISLDINDLIKKFRLARNIFFNGVHIRLGPNYEPVLEMKTSFGNSDPTGKAVELKLDSIDTYNVFNYKLGELYDIMTKFEKIYINDCLICDASDNSVMYKYDLTKRQMKHIKESALVKFALAFNLVKR